MNVITTNFNDETWSEFIRGDKSYLGNKHRTTFPAGTIIMLKNLTIKAIVGICVLANWADTESPVREHHPLDCDVYTGDNAKYNKYEMKINDLHIFKSPIPFDDIRILVGGNSESKKVNNIWRGFHSNFVSLFGADEIIIKRYKIWVKTLLL
jgi:hypothetical protein